MGPTELRDALGDHLWGGDTPHNTSLLEEASSTKVSFAGFLKLGDNLSTDSFKHVLDELDERDRAILLLTREHVRLRKGVFFGADLFVI